MYPCFLLFFPFAEEKNISRQGNPPWPTAKFTCNITNAGGKRQATPSPACVESGVNFETPWF